MENKKFLFSIIVPVYNTSKYIEKCLNSILQAMDKDCEVIIVNDGSTDDSEEKIKKFLSGVPQNLEKNFVYTKKANKGLADTKNVGIEMSNGEFISVVDSDDYISDDFYTIARKYTNDYDIIVYDLYVVFEKDKSKNYTSRAFRDYINNELASYLDGAMSGSSCNKIIKKSLYNGHKFPIGKQYEDTAVTPFILTEAKKIKYVPYPMYYYLQREKSIVATNTFASAFYKICNNITDVLDGKDIDKYKYVINEFYVKRIIDNLSEDMKESKKEFKNNLIQFANYNEKNIKYIYENKLYFNCENYYSDRQKTLCDNIFGYLKDKNVDGVIRLLKEREQLNKFKKLLKR